MVIVAKDFNAQWICKWTQIDWNEQLKSLTPLSYRDSWGETKSQMSEMGKKHTIACRCCRLVDYSKLQNGKQINTIAADLSAVTA